MHIATTALRKITALRKRIRGIQGGQGAGKTYSILTILINHAYSCSNKEIFIASAELSKMRITVIKDFVKVMAMFGIFDRSRWVDGTLYRFDNSSFIKFIGLDSEDIGKGLRSDVIFINEANKINFETYRELTSRANNVYIDFNPNSKFWFHTHIMKRDDCDFIKLTFQDNELLGSVERREILRYKEQGYLLDEAGNHIFDDNNQPRIINQYWANMWRVYGLGEVGQVEGRIYTWGVIPYQQYVSLPKMEVFGNDWGKVDPWAVAGIKYHDGDLYVDERLYASENEITRNTSKAELRSIRSGDDGEHEGLIGYTFNRIGIPKSAPVICDNNRPNKIISLRRSGWEYAVAVGGKPGLLDRISTLSNLNVLFTDRSVNIDMEQENYCYDKDREGNTLETPLDQNNHLLDAIAYGTQWMFREGIIVAA